MRAKTLVIPAMVLALALCGWESIRAASPAASTGSVSGSVRLDGPALKTQPIRMSSDPACAKSHPTPMPGEEVVTSGASLGNVTQNNFRSAIANALAQMGPEAAEAVKALQKALKDDSAAVRKQTAAAHRRCSLRPTRTSRRLEGA